MENKFKPGDLAMWCRHVFLILDVCLSPYNVPDGKEVDYKYLVLANNSEVLEGFCVGDIRYNSVSTCDSAFEKIG